ncbi:MAG: hypothetical protein SFV81_03440 [Pirellulaceae bacterium]|nr:hypothetical protein [Pirellulaceae bacterium]
MNIKAHFLVWFFAGLCASCLGQAPDTPQPTDESHTIILSPGRSKPLAFLYAASARANVTVNAKSIEQTIQLQVRIVQGETSKGESISLGLGGAGDVVDVQGDAIASWAVRTVDKLRYLDLQLKPIVEGAQAADKTATIRIRSEHNQLPNKVELAHLMPGKALGFDSQVEIQYVDGVTGKIVAAEGFAPLVSGKAIDRLQTATGGRLELQLDRDSALPPAAELRDATLVGDLHASGKSVSFQLRGTANVTVAGTRLRALSGNAAISQLPASDDYRLELVNAASGPVYEIVFPKVGSFPIAIDFVAALKTDAAHWQVLDFTVAASAVVPIRLRGLDVEIDFARDQQLIVPLLTEKDWQGFLPATGHVLLRWQSARNTTEGKSFFTTSSTIEASVGPGLLRQDHRITYQLLQGQLKSLAIKLVGPGEILSVEGDKIVAWKVVGEGNDRTLEIALNQPLTASSQVLVRSQTPLGTFPVRIDGLSVQPQGAIRNSGHLRISNSGSVSVEPTALRGLTQLAPEQFPGEALQARQLFVYRFPSADFGFTIAADRVQPELSVTQLLLYQLSETDRVISADIELDIREAAIREWNLSLPPDYSIVSVVGASVADYMAASDVVDGVRNLKVLFNQDVQGRQLVGLRLEKNEVAATGSWSLPHIEFPEAKAVRGDIGVVVAPGYRATVGSIELLVEKPLSYFPRPVANLQQAFRIREPGWKATMQIEQLERSIQSDVFHLYSLSQGTVYGSALINYSVTGAPVSEWQLTVPATLANVTVDGQEIRTWRRDGDTLIVSLQQPILGAYTLLVTFEEKPNVADGSFQAGLVTPLGVQGDRGFIEVVSPVQVEMQSLLVSSQLLVLDPLELPAEFRLLSTAPALGTWQYTQRPFDLRLKVNWFDPGTTAAQVVEFSEANSRVSQDGELVTDLLYYVKSRGQRTLKLQLPGEPVKLWAVAVNGRPVTARKAGDATLIPLPSGADPNAPIEVSLRLGKPAQDKRQASLQLPTVFAPVLKTQWNLKPDENHVLVPMGGSVEPTMPVVWPNGFDWLAGQGLLPLVGLAVLAIVVVTINSIPVRLMAMALAIIVAVAASMFAFQHIEPAVPLQLNLPVLASGEVVGLEVGNTPQWRAFISWPGVALVMAGTVLLVIVGQLKTATRFWFMPWIACGLVACGLLMQNNGATWFFGALALAILLLQFIPLAIRWQKDNKRKAEERAKSQADQTAPDGNAGAIVTTSILMLVLSSFSLCTPARALACELTEVAGAAEHSTIQSASSLIQKWTLTSRDKRLTASAEIVLSGRPGDRFVLLRAPAVLTEFNGAGLRLSKIELPNQGLAYVVTIPAEDKQPEGQAADETPSAKQYKASFQFQLEAIQVAEGIPVLTGSAALQQIDLTHDEANWEVVCDSAARIETVAADAQSGQGSARARLLLGPGSATIRLRPQGRDLTAEQTQFFVEGAGLYTPGPGVIDGKHRLKIRTSQGRVQQLSVVIPAGLTVSSVEGPVSSWQFDADQSRLRLQIDAATPPEFTVTVETQRSLDALPTVVELTPVRVEGAGGEVGLIALAFGTEAQPENVQADGLSLVNLGDFDASLLTNPQATLHRVYRYGSQAGKLSVQVSPVAPEVRVASKQVVSFGDERVVLSVNFVTEITRTGLFQLSFPLPAGLEVESLTGEALHHWSELSENGKRQIVLHLKGKTLGVQKFSLTLAGAVTSEVTEWPVPRFELNESMRQSGDLVVQPITGIRLRTVTRQNVSEADPRSLGAQGQGALAFRLLQRDWSLQLGIEKLAPWVTGQVLHDVTLREGQTRSTLLADFTVQNAAIRTLLVKLPTMGADELKTVRANGETVSDFVRSTQDESVWELRFKRRVIGPVQFQIEFERRGERAGDRESLNVVEFPDARQVGYYFAVRAGGRLEIESGTLTQGWQRSDWSTVPQTLREAGNRNAPALTLRAMAPTTPLSLRVIRHSLADALKLRVASGTLTTVLSPTGDQLTSVDVNMEVIQRSSLSVQLPEGSELFSIFVNGESVHSIRQKVSNNTWQFYILPGIDDRTAQVRFVYSLTGDSLRKLTLVSPQLNVPLENIQWNVIAPSGFQLIDNDGNLELVGQASKANYDRQSYLSAIQGKQKDQAQQAAKLLEQANQLLQTGQQSKAQWAFNNVANRYALDAASNEDARVQLENLQTQQAIVGLNTRRQRLFLDSNRGSAAVADNEQMRQAAATNPILQQEQLNYRPQELSQLLAGNSKEDNAILQQIAGRLVQHQRTTEPAPQAIVISLPEDGNIYSFRRSVQVAENAPLELQLQFHSQYKLQVWQWTMLVGLVGLLMVGLAWRVRS